MTLTRVYNEKGQLGQKEIQLYSVRMKRVPSFVLKEVREARRECREWCPQGQTPPSYSCNL